MAQKKILATLKNCLNKRPFLTPLLEAYPLRPLEEAPESIKKMAIANAFPAVNDGHAVYWDMDTLFRWGRKMQTNTAIPEDIANYLHTKFAISPEVDPAPSVIQEMADLITQQYLHLLYQHTRSTRYFNHEKIDEKVFRIATEIEVNRFPALIDSATFWSTPNHRTFPETATCLSLRQTYAVLLKSMSKLNISGDGDNESQGNSSDGHENAQEGGSRQKDASNTNPDDKDASKAQKTSNNGKSSSSDKEEIRKQDAISAMTPQLHQFNADDDLIGDSTIAKKAEDYNVKELSQLVLKRWSNNIVRKQMRRLRSVLQGEVSRSKRKTFAHPSRRPIGSSNLIKKGIAKDLCGQPKILVAVDMSGSMSSVRSQAVLDAVGNTFEDLGRPSKGCYICIFDDEVRKVVPFRHYKNILGGYHPRWGTRYSAVIDLANELDVDVVIEIGDGFDFLSRGQKFELDRCAQFYKAGRKWYDLIVGQKKDDKAMSLAVEYNANLFGGRDGASECFYHVLTDLQKGYPRYVMSNDCYTNLNINACVQLHPQFKKYFL